MPHDGHCKYSCNRYRYNITSWWRHQMETFYALLAICAGNSPVTGEFPAQRPETRSFDVVFDLHLNKRLSKQSLGWWFKTQSRPLWRHCNVNASHLKIRYHEVGENFICKHIWKLLFYLSISIDILYLFWWCGIDMILKIFQSLFVIIKLPQ